MITPSLVTQTGSIRHLRSIPSIVGNPSPKPSTHSHFPYLFHPHTISPFLSGNILSPRSSKHRIMCSVSPSIGAASSSPSSTRLLIVGPGVLGSRLGALWLEHHGENTVVGQTNTSSNHERLRKLGIVPRTNTEGLSRMENFPFVVFSAPPSGSEDYVKDIKAALNAWDGTGCFLFTSSAAVYDVEDGSACDESAPTVPLGRNERSDRLLLAEKTVLDAGGCVVRLVGLYHRSRGAHTFFLKQKEVSRWGGYTVNLIHYEDAASISAAILNGQGIPDGEVYRGRIFLGCDGNPITFREMMDSVESSGQFPGHVDFVGVEGPVKGKRMSNQATKTQLDWEPKYGSFKEFFEGGAKDWYCEDAEGALAPVGTGHA